MEAQAEWYDLQRRAAADDLADLSQELGLY